MTMLVKGSEEEQIHCGFSLASPNTQGELSKTNFENLLDSFERSLGKINKQT